MDDLLPLTEGRWFVIAENRLSGDDRLSPVVNGQPKIPPTSKYYDVVFWMPRMVVLNMRLPNRAWIYLHEDLLTEDLDERSS